MKKKNKIKIESSTIGKVVDMGTTDVNDFIIKYCKISSCQKIMSKNDLIFDIFDRFPRYNFLETFKKNRYARNINISKFYNSIMKTL